MDKSINSLARLVAMMKPCFLVYVLVAAAHARTVDPIAASSAFRYHERVGIPQAALIKAAEEKNASKIVGGTPSILGSLPYLVGLIIDLDIGLQSVCAASLISSNHIVTSARCWWDGNNYAQGMLAVLGSTVLFSQGTRVPVTSYHAHPSYSPFTINHDILVGTITEVQQSAYIAPIRLPQGSQLGETYIGDMATASGYGVTSDDEPLTTLAYLNQVQLPVISNFECLLTYGSLVTNNVLCTSGTAQANICAGDEGGPLTVLREGTPILIGVASFRAYGECVGRPSGYTRITSYVPWIQSFL